MVRKVYTPEQIINKLREAEVLISQGATASEASRKIGVTEQTYYRWRKEVEKENARLKKLVADISLGNAILKDGCPGKLLSPLKRRKIIKRIHEKLTVFERRACKVLEQARMTQRYCKTYTKGPMTPYGLYCETVRGYYWCCQCAEWPYDPI